MLYAITAFIKAGRFVATSAIWSGSLRIAFRPKGGRMDKAKTGTEKEGGLLSKMDPAQSPVKLLVIMVLSVFTAELLVMVILYIFADRLSPVLLILVDAPLLIIFLSPILYYFLFRPLLLLVEERSRAELALRLEKNRFQTYLDIAGVMVLVLGAGGRVTLINRRGCEILGYPEEEIVGKNWFDNFLPERVRDEVRLVFANIISGGEEAEGYFENPVLTRSGKERVVLWHNVLLEECGRVTGVLSSGEDITERKLTETALKESETRYRLVHNTAFDGIIIANAGDLIIDCNESAAKIFGYSKDELVGKDLDIIVPDKYKKRHKEGLKRYIETGVSDIQGKVVEYEGLRKNGEVFPMELALNNFTLGGVIHFTGMMRDITERKRAEKERELIQMRLNQSQKMEAIGRFAGGIAHDFNNILTAIRGNAELALEEIRKSDPLHQRLDGIILSVMLASKLTKQLLLFSRGQPFELGPLNINQIVEDLLVMITRLIGEDITVSAELAPDLWTVEADEGTIEQVIMNLSVNAKDAMPDGGTLTIRTENVVVDREKALTMPDARPGEAVCLSVADTGVGMEKELVQRIFEPFFTTKEAGKGTGFGLAVVYTIVKQQNGWITVKSEPGKGTSFRIYFPALSRKRETRGEEARNYPNGTGEIILVIEDEPQVREYARAALSEHGYKVLEASSAKEAVAVFEREGKDLSAVLCDVILSDRSGFDLAEELMNRKQGLAVVMTSGFLEVSQRPLLSKHGYRYLQKPYALSSLLKIVREAIDSGKR